MKCTGGGATTKGPNRKQNEDAWRVYETQLMVRRAGRGYLYAVADGVGGTGAGRYASWHVVDSMAFFFNVPAGRFHPGNTTRDIILQCHQTLNRLAKEKKEYTMAATTLALLYVAPNHMRGYSIGIGDSGVFVLREGTLHQINTDHRDERGKVTSSIGNHKKLAASHRSLKFKDGDVVCLCTDGVREELSLERITREMAAYEHPSVVAERLAVAAEEAGGRDNSTAVIVRFGDCPEPPRTDDDEDDDD